MWIVIIGAPVALFAGWWVIARRCLRKDPNSNYYNRY